jgi:hypothetical protein
LLLEAFRQLVNSAYYYSILIYKITINSVLSALYLRYAYINASLLLVYLVVLL